MQRICDLELQKRHFGAGPGNDRSLLEFIQKLQIFAETERVRHLELQKEHFGPGLEIDGH